MQTTAALRLARTILDEHGLRDWTVGLDRAKTRAGATHFARRRITLSAPLTRVHDQALVRDTILHEVAHALAGPRHGHDARWRRIAEEIGCSGERCVPADAPRVEPAWLGICPAGHTVGRHRRPERVTSCSQCSRAFDLAHLLTWTHQGRVATMHPNFVAELERLRGGQRQVLLAVGSRVRVAEAAGEEYAGREGRVLKRGRTCYHVRLAGRLVLRVPFAWVEPAG